MSMFSVDQLDSVFMRKLDAARILDLTAWQLNQLIFSEKLSTPRIAGHVHLYTADVDRLRGSQAVKAARQMSDPTQLRRQLRKEATWGIPR